MLQYKLLNREFWVGAAKLLFIFILSFSFINWMAWPSLSRYMRGGVLVETSTVTRPALPAPAVTICPRVNGDAWLNITWR